MQSTEANRIKEPSKPSVFYIAAVGIAATTAGVLTFYNDGPRPITEKQPEIVVLTDCLEAQTDPESTPDSVVIQCGSLATDGIVPADDLSAADDNSFVPSVESLKQDIDQAEADYQNYLKDGYKLESAGSGFIVGAVVLLAGYVIGLAAEGVRDVVADYKKRQAHKQN